MASKELNVKIKHRYDTASNWTTNNPVLLAGELGIESDTGKIKVGDGTTLWSRLGYVTPSLPKNIAYTDEQNTFSTNQYISNGSLIFNQENGTIMAYVGKFDGDAIPILSSVFRANNTSGVVEIGGNQMPIKASGLTDGTTTKSMSEVLAGGGGGVTLRRWSD